MTRTTEEIKKDITEMLKKSPEEQLANSPCVRYACEEMKKNPQDRHCYAEVCLEAEKKYRSSLKTPPDDNCSELSNRGKAIDKKIDIIYEWTDAKLCEGDFDSVNMALMWFSTFSLLFEPEILVGMLTITLPAKSKLPTRKLFYSKVLEVVKDERILKGLK